MNTRLDKFLSHALNLSRTDVKKLIRGGGVSVNGLPEKSFDRHIDFECDEVRVNGVPVSGGHIYIALNKPSGYVSSTEDSKDRTVLELVPETLMRKGLFPAGRLDKYTTGLMIITDDGEFAHNILSPAHHIEKVYTAVTDRKLDSEQEVAFRRGVCPREELFKSAGLEYKGVNEHGFVYEVRLREGRYHQIKRMFDSFGAKVLLLHRTAIGELALPEGLKPGECVEVRREDITGE